MGSLMGGRAETKIIPWWWWWYIHIYMLIVHYFNFHEYYLLMIPPYTWSANVFITSVVLNYFTMSSGEYEEHTHLSDISIHIKLICFTFSNSLKEITDWTLLEAHSCDVLQSTVKYDNYLILLLLFVYNITFCS